MLSKDVVDLLSQSGLPGITDYCIIFSGKIPKAFPAPTNKIVILIQDIQNAPGVHGSDSVLTKSDTIQMQIFYPSTFSENNTEVDSSVGIKDNDVEPFEDEIIKFLNYNNIYWSFGSGCLVDPATNQLYSTFHFNINKTL